MVFSLFRLVRVFFFRSGASDACPSAPALSAFFSSSSSFVIRIFLPSMMDSATFEANSSMALTASSFPGMGYSILSGSPFVSTTATIGIFIFWASARAIASLDESMTNMAPGS